MITLNILFSLIFSAAAFPLRSAPADTAPLPVWQQAAAQRVLRCAKALLSLRIQEHPQRVLFIVSHFGENFALAAAIQSASILPQKFVEKI